ncbi:tRNA threonylcarbamoyladenosine biosynthesis protein TsaE [Malonomonas rubra DSM 5091]|uniref:tRNA threonylcarbamoyladenosine biosynthesis protein TsaE n=1 Tax=Malonomonas rubra DSM 5091 TaxID=1122189 RepID=A0A1M6F0N2_MALRU|nr:tRNA (adenosine(37)-N6)-threonylcarbamoyltransferase complex ATPase subunit type 1 TsaE [Malonomonas rubra]SHI91201.1 tRNA threonylcarbamoyladenosine biosynthesis protein TsaE [Malonomonas rubra DSM 5091]
MQKWSFDSSGEQQTLELGMQLGRLLEQPALILLHGTLGAGKSVLARGIARGLGVPEEVPITSPTFTLMNHYPARLDLYHFDLYRLCDPDELIEIGFDDYAFGNGVTLVEWPERMDNDSVAGLWVNIELGDENQRRLNFSAQGVVAEALLTRLQQTFSA